MRAYNTGFTLIEMAMVLGLMAIFMGFGMDALNSYTNVSRARDTVDHIETVKAYLDAYAAQNDRYPCPARKDRRPGFAQNSGPEFGKETCDTSYVTQVAPGILAGAVPVRTLNLREQYAGDKWNNKITYVVTQTLTSAGGYTSRRGAIEVYHGTPADSSDILKHAAYLLISHGANGSADNGGATSMKELSTQSCTANASPDSRNCVFSTNRFYTAEHNPTETATVSGNDAFFDDHVLWGTNLLPGLATCEAGPVNWTVGSDTCSSDAPLPEREEGQIVTATDSSGSSGTQNFVCDASGNWVTSGGGTCASASCPSTSVSWSSGPASCSKTLSAGTAGSTQLANDNSGSRGQRNYECTGGTWTPTETGTCNCAYEISSGQDHSYDHGACGTWGWCGQSAFPMVPCSSPGDVGGTKTYLSERSWSGYCSPRGYAPPNMVTCVRMVQTCRYQCSDIRLKTHIVQVASMSEFGIYEFSYKHDPAQTRYRGVMAQEVRHIPGAVVTMPNGYYAVNYDRVGVAFERIE